MTNQTLPPPGIASSRDQYAETDAAPAQDQYAVSESNAVAYVGMVFDDAGAATVTVRQTRRPIPGKGEFRALADWWHEVTDSSSSPSRKTKHRAYRRIIEMGPPVLRYILEDLRDTGGQWFDALQEINGGIPFSTETITTHDQAKNAWLEWGRARGLIS